MGIIHGQRNFDNFAQTLNLKENKSKKLDENKIEENYPEQISENVNESEISNQI